MKYFAIVESDSAMKFLGEFEDPRAVFQSPISPEFKEEILWILDELSAAEWAQVVVAHPAANGWFGINTLSGKLVFLAVAIDAIEIQLAFQNPQAVAPFDNLCWVLNIEQARRWLEVLESAGVPLQLPPT